MFIRQWILCPRLMSVRNPPWSNLPLSALQSKAAASPAVLGRNAHAAEQNECHYFTHWLYTVIGSLAISEAKTTTIGPQSAVQFPVPVALTGIAPPSRRAAPIARLYNFLGSMDTTFDVNESVNRSSGLAERRNNSWQICQSFRSRKLG
jgi:hypothetical protein